ncbi:hypothetical protein [Nocardia bovistercoris]|uniref:Uncharacterized protein n=1 Tax=Nocardia bovistercoris TaxID=2785916 RepID=A0A931N560_9NOCA|nr:hypothetical protein [Nocardia bovistercoris]MBH0779407.1 hypothetical protein [Nocardia bovistercoris]
MAANNTPSPRPRTLDSGSAWLSGLIVTALTGGVAVLSASILAAIAVAVGISAALALTIGLMH